MDPFEEGSSGSPVFLQNGEQLAGIIALSELGANEGERAICARRLSCPRQQFANISNGFEHDLSTHSIVQGAGGVWSSLVGDNERDIEVTIEALREKLDANLVGGYGDL
jgi:hypothetical protein